MINYTEIRDDLIRGKICKLMSVMLDNPDKHGIYPTSEFMWKMETYVLEYKSKIKQLEVAIIEAKRYITLNSVSYEILQRALEVKNE